MGYYYPKRASGQMKNIITRFNRGINSYNETVDIPDNFLSGGWNVAPMANNEAIRLWTTLYTTADDPIRSNLTNTGTQDILAQIADQDTTGDEHIILITKDSTTGHNEVIDYLVDFNYNDNTKTSIDISSYALADNNVRWSMCLYYTEAARYVMYANSNQAKLLVYNYSTTSTVSLPFTPRRICSHANRIFAVDTFNKLWWSRAGDYTSWYGAEVDDDKIVTTTNMINGAYVIAAQPDVPRPIMITVTPVSTTDTMGTVTIVGTASDDSALTEVITPKSGIAIGFRAFKTVTSATGAGWSANAGTDQIKIGTAAVNGFVQADAGMWTLENERQLNGLFPLGENLYIWSENAIYVFSGNSYDTFSLNKMFSGIGIASDANWTIESCRGNIYFLNNNCLYEFDGRSFPMPINKPVYTNGAVANGVYGGISGTVAEFTTNDKYVYANFSEYNILSSTLYQFEYSVFDVESRAWWPREGLTATVTFGDNARVYFIPKPYKAGFWSILQVNNASTFTYTITAQHGGTYDAKSYIITKGFSSGISDDMTLTQINLKCCSSLAPYSGANETEEIKIYYSLSTLFEQSTSEYWTLLNTIDGALVTKDVSTLKTYCIGSEIARAENFRLKIEWNSIQELEIYGLELRYRVIGQSR